MVGGGGWWNCKCDVIEEEPVPDAAAAVKEVGGGDDDNYSVADVEEGGGEDDGSVVDVDGGVGMSPIVPSTFPRSGRSMRQAVGGVSLSPPSLAPSAFSPKKGDPFSMPSSPISPLAAGEVSVLNIIHPGILRFGNNNITFEPRSGHEEDRRLLTRLGIFENDTLIKINDTKLTEILKGPENRRRNLDVFKDLTKGTPNDLIRFYFTNDDMERSDSDPVNIKLMSEVEIERIKAEKFRTGKEQRKLQNAQLHNEGGRNFSRRGIGGKKKTHRRKKPVSIRRRKPSRRTKKMKVMVGGVKPETSPATPQRPTPPPSDSTPPAGSRRTARQSLRDTPPPDDSVASVSEPDRPETPISPVDESPTPDKYNVGTVKNLECTCTKEKVSSSAKEAANV
jgi:hypothetical protein